MADVKRPAWWQVPRWPLWSLPTQALGTVLIVIILALALPIDGLIRTPPTRDQLTLAALLTALCMVHTEILIGVEQIRRHLSRDRPATTGHNDLSSVWTFAAALLLPPALSAAATFVMLTHLWWRAFRPTGNPAYRGMHSRATSMIACFFVGIVLEGMGVVVGGGGATFEAALAILAAMLIYITINTGLVAATASLADPRIKFDKMLGTLDDNATEIATLGLGAVLAVILSGANAWVAGFLIPVLLVLHRAVAIQQMEHEAATDEMTGLLNSPAWHRAARRQLNRAARRHQGACLLLLDLDGFRKINEAHGRDGGDAVLAAVGAALARGARQYQLLGRLSAEEFVLLLPEVDEDEIYRVAGWLKTEVALVRVTLDGTPAPATVDGVTASIGGALFPQDGHTLEDLLSAADRALQAAKRIAPTDGFELSPPADETATSLPEFRRRRLRENQQS